MLFVNIMLDDGYGSNCLYTTILQVYGSINVPLNETNETYEFYENVFFEVRNKYRKSEPR